MVCAALLLMTQGCTERLTTPGGCPAFCPGGEPVYRDTVIDAVIGLDSSYTGYTPMSDPISLPLSEDPELGESRGVIAFLPRGDSVVVGDTVFSLAIDSIVIRLGLQDRTSGSTGLRLEVYRLDSDTDTLITWDALDAQMVPANLLRSVAIPDNVPRGPLNLRFTGDELAKFAPPAVEGTRLVIGVRLAAATGSAAGYIGANRSGDAGPMYQTWSTVTVDDTVQHPLVQRIPAENFTVRRRASTVASDQLLLGGFPASRPLLRFALPPFLRDSAAIVRATLELDTAVPLRGIPGDSSRIEVNAVVADFGAKSVVLVTNTLSNLAWIHDGDSHLAIEVTPLIRFWQGSNPLPAALRLKHSFEWSSFLNPLLISTRSSSAGSPRIRITYRPPFAVDGF